MRHLVLAALLLASPLTRADEESARDHFQRGQLLYDGSRYEAALHEFEVAYATQPVPALLYDIARCLEQLGRKAEAAQAYERFLESSPEAENASEIRARIDDLRKPVEAVTLSRVNLSPPPKHRYVAPGVVAGGALALGVIGAGLLGSAAHDYGALRSSCLPTCSTSSWSALPAHEHAGEALLGIAGAALVVDVVLWVRAARRSR